MQPKCGVRARRLQELFFRTSRTQEDLDARVLRFKRTA
jgi:hypothetical protein